MKVCCSMKQLIFLKEFYNDKSNKSVEYMICHYWYFKEIGFKYQPYICNKCHDLSMVVQDLKDLMILKTKVVDYRCYVFNMSKKDVIKLLNK